jgi:hypothetical protein
MAMLRCGVVVFWWVQTFLGVELNSETTDIAHGISRAAASQNGREPNENGSFSGCVGKDASARHIGSGLEKSEGTKSASASGMDNTLGNALMIESVDLNIELVFVIPE